MAHSTYDEVDSYALNMGSTDLLNNGSTLIKDAITQADIFIDNRLTEYAITSSGSADTLINLASANIAASIFSENRKVNMNKEVTRPASKVWMDRGSTFLWQFVQIEKQGVKDHLNDYGPPRAIWSTNSDSPNDYTQNSWS